MADDDDTPLEKLLRDTHVTNGTISLLRLKGGQWRAVIAHNAAGEDHPLSHMVHPGEKWDDDPVGALWRALIEDDRICTDLRRRYLNADKLGPAVIEDMDDILG